MIVLPPNKLLTGEHMEHVENNMNNTSEQAHYNPAQLDGRLREAQLKMRDILSIIDTICQKHAINYWLERGSLLGAIRHQGFIPWDDDLDIAMPRADFEKFLQVAPAELPQHLWLQTPYTDPGYFSLCVPLKIRDLSSHVLVMHESGKEPYKKGIFIDIFPYDLVQENKFKRKLRKTKTNRLLRLLTWKYNQVPLGHYATLYKNISRFIPRRLLENRLRNTIKKANNSNSGFMGYGYDCIHRSFVSMDQIYPLKRTNFEGIQVNIANQPEVILTQIYGDFMQLPPEKNRVMKHYKVLIPNIK